MLRASRRLELKLTIVVSNGPIIAIEREAQLDIALESRRNERLGVAGLERHRRDAPNERSFGHLGHARAVSPDDVVETCGDPTNQASSTHYILERHTPLVAGTDDRDVPTLIADRTDATVAATFTNAAKKQDRAP